MEKIEKLTDDLAFIQKLGDNPNTDDGLSADELKAVFDKAPLRIQKFINEVVIPTLNKKVDASDDGVLPVKDGGTGSDGADAIKNLLEAGYLVLSGKQYGPSFPEDAPDGTLFFIPLEAVSS